jgi:hypothetical protein
MSRLLPSVTFIHVHFWSPLYVSPRLPRWRRNPAARPKFGTLSTFQLKNGTFFLWHCQGRTVRSAEAADYRFLNAPASGRESAWYPVALTLRFSYSGAVSYSPSIVSVERVYRVAGRSIRCVPNSEQLEVFTCHLRLTEHQNSLDASRSIFTELCFGDVKVSTEHLNPHSRSAGRLDKALRPRSVFVEDEWPDPDSPDAPLETPWRGSLRPLRAFGSGYGCAEVKVMTWQRGLRISRNCDGQTNNENVASQYIHALKELFCFIL